MAPPDDETLRGVGKAVDYIVNRYNRFGWVHGGLPEDMRQEGWKIALETLARGTYDPAKPLGGYLCTAINRQMAPSVTRWVSCVSLGKNPWTKAKGENQTVIGSSMDSPSTPHEKTGGGGITRNLKNESGIQVVDPGELPDQGVIKQEQKEWLVQWRDRLQEALEVCMLEQPEAHREIIKMRYGIGTISVGATEISMALKKPVKEVHKTLEKFAKVAKADIRLYSLYVELQQNKDEHDDGS